MENNKSFLIVHTNGIGDFLMFSPALKEIIKKYPDCKIDVFLTNSNVKNLIENYPNIEKIYTSPLNIIKILKTVKHLRKNYYDYLIITTGGKTWKAGILSILLKAKIKIGEYVYIRNLFYTFNIKRYNFTHFVENNIRMVRKIIEFPITVEYKLWFPVKEIKMNKNKFRIGIHPGCQKLYKERRWPKFRELIIEIKNKYSNIEIFVFLGNEDIELEKDFIELKNITIVKNKTINEIANYLKTCDLFINSDSGLGHLYTCFNEKIISIFGPNQIGISQELRTGPYSNKAIIIKKRGMPEKYYSEIGKNGILKCLEDITVEEVTLKIENLLRIQG